MGEYTAKQKHVVRAPLTRRQLWSYFHEKQFDAFLSVASTNEVFEKGFAKA